MLMLKMAEKSMIVDVDDGTTEEQNRVNDELSFQDFPHDNMDDGRGMQEKGKTHTFTDFPHSAGSDDEEGDKAELLEGERKPPSFWSFEYYQQFFDVDTYEVLQRILGSMLPLPRRNFLRSKIRPNPDLYGPFWICATLVFTTAIAGNLASYLQSAGQDYKWNYEFNKVTIAATAIYSYWWLVPTALFGMLWWRGSQAGYSFLEIICVYGYSLAIYIPISILWVIDVPALQWILVIVGTSLSGGVLLLTFWPAVREDNKKIAIGIMVAIFIFHVLLATGFLFYFFRVSTTRTEAQVIVNVTNVQLHKNEIANADNVPVQSNDQMSPTENDTTENDPGPGISEEISSKSKPAVDDQQEKSLEPANAQEKSNPAKRRALKA